MRILYSYIRKHYWKAALIIGVGGLISSISSILMNVSLQKTVDYLFEVEDSRFIMSLCLVVVMAIFTFFCDQIVENYLVMKYKLQFVRDIRKRLIKKHCSIPYSVAKERDIGELMNRNSMVDDLAEIYVTLLYYLPYCLLECLLFIVYLSVSVSWKMNVVLVALLPFALLFKHLSEQMRLKTGELVKHKADSHHFFLDVATKLDYVKANNFGQDLDILYFAKNKRILESERHIFSRDAIYSFSKFILENGITLSVPLVGAVMLAKGIITPGGVAVSTTIFSSFLVPSLFQLIGIFKEIKTSQEIVCEIIGELQDNDYNCFDDNVSINRTEQSVLVHLDNVSYAYDTSCVLRNISFDLPVKGSVGISGVSGSGKSTLGKLLVNLFHPSKGKVIYNSIFFDEKDFYKKIIYMSTDPFFMEDSVKENIKAGGNDWEKALNAKCVVNLWDELPCRIDTIINEGATNLSGGQKQLLAVSRALAKSDACLIVMDEPNSSLDICAKKQLTELIQQLSQSKCIVVITHDTLLYNQLDYQFVLVDGELRNITQAKEE